MSSGTRVALLLDGSRGWDAGVLRGIAQYVNLHQPWQFLRPATVYQHFSGLTEVTFAELRKHRPDGVVMHESPLTAKLLRMGIPTVVVPKNAVKDSRYYVVSDDEKVGELAARHLVRQGLKYFGFVGFAKVRWSHRRWKAFKDQLHEHGRQAIAHLVPLTPDDHLKQRLHQNLVHWLREFPKPAGLFVANDDLARAVAELCQFGGITVPEDIALLGVDNDELICDLCHPPLSSIPLATVQAGYRAAELLDRLMKGKTPDTNVIPVDAMEVVVRRSTDRLAVDDPEVVKAIRYIRDNASRIIQVRDVVQATSLSHRTLHNRFTSVVGHSIIKEINQQRAVYISNLLVDTTLSVKRIAWGLGYHDDAHLTRFFRREMGETPAAYRRRFSHGK